MIPSFLAERPLPFALLLLAGATFVRFSLALRGHFDSARMPPGMVALSLLAVVCVLTIGLLVWAALGGVPAALGLAGVLASHAIFARALADSAGGRLKVAFDPDLPGQILTRGIYGRVRHPMYAAYLLFWASFALGAADGRALVPAGAMIAVYVALARSEERRLLASGNGAAYAAHRARTGMFWPGRGAAR